jgi:Bacterial Ig-like domain/Calx-beta domain
VACRRVWTWGRPTGCQQVSVDYATSNGTAVAGRDYTATSGVLTFSPGQIFGQIVVPIQPGTSGGTLSITLSSRTNAAVGPISQFRVTITTTAPPLGFNPPQLEPSDDSGTKGDGITDDVTPAFFGSADPNETVQLVSGTRIVGTTTSNAQGHYVVSVGQALAPGSYSFRIVANDRGLIAASSPLRLRKSIRVNCLCCWHPPPGRVPIGASRRPAQTKTRSTRRS